MLRELHGLALQEVFGGLKSRHAATFIIEDDLSLSKSLGKALARDGTQTVILIPIHVFFTKY